MTEALVLLSFSNVFLWAMGTARSIFAWQRCGDRMARRRVVISIALTAVALILVAWAVREHDAIAWAEFTLGAVSGAMFSGGIMYLLGGAEERQQ